MNFLSLLSKYRERYSTSHPCSSLPPFNYRWFLAFWAVPYPHCVTPHYRRASRRERYGFTKFRAMYYFPQQQEPGKTPMEIWTHDDIKIVDTTPFHGWLPARDAYHSNFSPNFIHSGDLSVPPWIVSHEVSVLVRSNCSSIEGPPPKGPKDTFFTGTTCFFGFTGSEGYYFFGDPHKFTRNTIASLW